MSGTKVAWLCEALQVSRSGYYDWLRRRDLSSARQRQDTDLVRRIREIFVANKKAYGSPRITRELGGVAGRHRVARLMRQAHLVARQRSKYRPKGTDSRHGYPVAPNHLKSLQVERIDQVWAMDATYVLTAQGWLYVTAAIDLHSRRIVGWSMSDNLDTSAAIAALRMACQRKRPTQPVMVHSDRGTQFANHAFRAELKRRGFVASMSRKGNCYDNAFIESFWSSMKLELIKGCRFRTRDEARTAIFHYIENYYNRDRLHSSLGYMSPVAFESLLTT
jgi:transposase InsO family protein